MKAYHVIPNVKRLHWLSGRDNTFMGSLEALLETTENKIGYDDLMGISGAAFRFQIHEDWCPSSPDASCGYNCAQKLLRKLKIKYELIDLKDKNEDELKKIKEKIFQSLEKDIPVLALDLKVAADFGLITGYEDYGEELFCRTYYDETKDYSYVKKYPKLVYIFNQIDEMPNLDPLVKESIDYITYINDAKNKNNYYCGICGFEYWIFDLEDEEKFDSFEVHKKLQHPNAWIYYSLLDSRKAAVRYLDKHKDIIDKAKPLIDLYSEIVDILKKGSSHVKFPHELDYSDWNHEYRRKQAETIRKVLEIEEKINNIMKDKNKQW